MPQNNTWINPSNSRCVIVFVHGILSDSGAWKNKKAGTYWPQMLVEDEQFEDVAVFVSGYTAGLGAGLYDVPAAANEVLAHLRNPTTGPAPLDKDFILFICHSQGGIVVRQMLTTNFEEFAKKKVGLILCGSPSWGSLYGTLFAPITFLIRFRQGTALSWGGSALRNLDREFLNMIEKKRIPDLEGLCLAETKGSIFGIPVPKVVGLPSATRYFKWEPIAHTTHKSLVKPASRTHGSYVHTRDFARRHHFLPRGSLKKSLDELLDLMLQVERAYDLTSPAAPKVKTQLLAHLFATLRSTYDLRDREDRLPKPEFRGLMNADVDAAQGWAFDNFSRQKFTDLRILLQQISNDLSS